MTNNETQEPCNTDVRCWKLFECDNCKAMYLEKPVSECDCATGANKFTERNLIEQAPKTAPIDVEALKCEVYEFFGDLDFGIPTINQAGVCKFLDHLVSAGYLDKAKNKER